MSNADDDAIRGLGMLAVTFGRVEVGLFLLAVTFENDESAVHERARWSPERLVEDIEARSDAAAYGAFTDRVRNVLAQLEGDGGLIKQRNRYIHAIWRSDEDGVLTRTNLRRLIFENQPDAVMSFDAMALYVCSGRAAIVGDEIMDVVRNIWPDE